MAEVHLYSPHFRATVQSGHVRAALNRQTRSGFKCEETLELAREGRIVSLREPDSEEVVEAVTFSYEDFISGHERGTDAFVGTQYSATWKQAGFSRRVLVAELDPETGLICCEVTNTGDEPIRFRTSVRLPGSHRYWNRKGTMVRLPAGPLTEVGREHLREMRLGHSFELPPQDVFVYFNYLVAGRTSITPDASVHECELRPAETVQTHLMMANSTARSVGDSLFIVERGNWPAATAALTWQPCARTQDGHIRTFPPTSFNPFLWYSPAEGVLHYQRFFLQLSQLQSIFFAGPIIDHDLGLLAHILALKEQLPPRKTADGRLESPSKIFLFTPREEDADGQRTMDLIRSQVLMRLFESQGSEVLGYYPRTEPILVTRSWEALPIYRRAMISWYGEAPRSTLAVIPPDPTAAALVGPFARLLGADIAVAEGGRIVGVDLNRPPYDRLLTVLPNGHGAIDNLLDSIPFADNATSEHIRFEGHGQLSRLIGNRILSQKWLDFEGFADTERSNAQATTVVRTVAEAYGVVKGGPDAQGRLRTGSWTVDDPTRLPADFQRRLFRYFCDKAPAAFRYHTTPAYHLELTPAAILCFVRGEEADVLFPAANLSAARLSPIQVCQMEATAEGLAKEWADVRKVVLHRSGTAEAAEAIDQLGARLGASFTYETTRALEDWAPLALTLVSGSSCDLPFELGTLCFESDTILQMAGAADPGPGHLPDLFRVGRVAGPTPEVNCRVLAHAGLAYRFARGEGIRVMTCGDPRADLPAARKESRAWAEFAKALLGSPASEHEVVEAQGQRCSSTWFLNAASGDVDFIHFAGHGASSPIDQFNSRLSLSNGPLTGLQIRNELSLRRSPVVFLNACDSGSGAASVAYSFTNAGAGTVVATLWPVFDDAASHLGRLFLSLCLGGMSVGAALNIARMRSLGEAERGTEAQNRLTPNAYILIGDPLFIPFIDHFRLRFSKDKGETSGPQGGTA